MLPFLDHKKAVTMIVGARKEGESPLSEVDAKDAKEMCAQKILEAIKSDDAQSLSGSLTDFFELLESEEGFKEG